MRKPRKRSAGFLVSTMSDELFNRDSSWLEFNRRVLAQAEDEGLPILERIRFLTIFTSNLDEFFMNRIGGLKHKLEAGFNRASNAVGSVKSHAAILRQTVLAMLEAQQACHQEQLLPALRKNGVFMLSWSELSKKEREFATTYYQSKVFPVLTPQAVDPGHPFPFISNLSVSLAVEVLNPFRDESLFARVKIPNVLPQVLRLDTAEYPDQARFVSLRGIIENNLETLFPGMLVQSVMPFRVTRNADIELDEEETEDLVELIQEELRERKFAKVIRLEHGPATTPTLLRFLMEEMEIAEEDVYESVPAVDQLSLKELSELHIPFLKYEPWVAVTNPLLADEEANIFSLIRSSDILVHHPYEAFSSSVERFLRTAVEDPKVLAIKMTLYRTGDGSSLIPLLIRAAEQDKQVVCLIEVKAHFDEARNIRVAQTLEAAGVHVMYGVVGLKTHAKVILVVRQEQDTLRCYAHLGTGNYNSTTAKFYTDLGLFTAHPEICEDLVELFHFLTGRSLKTNYRRLLVAPSGLKDRLFRLIDQEIINHQKGRPAHIVIKANGLEDTMICRALLNAAQKGVRVDLLIRGICCLKPFGHEDDVRPGVLSVVSRFLEHSRIFYFRNGAEDPLEADIFISSADLMYRNLHRRVEVAVPLLNPAVKERCWEILQVMLQDNSTAWQLQPDGTYVRRQPAAGESAYGSQESLMRITKGQFLANSVNDDALF